MILKHENKIKNENKNVFKRIQIVRVEPINQNKNTRIKVNMKMSEYDRNVMAARTFKANSNVSELQEKYVTKLK